jgi:hypothetical protein
MLRRYGSVSFRFWIHRSSIADEATAQSAANNTRAAKDHKREPTKITRKWLGYARRMCSESTHVILKAGSMRHYAAYTVNEQLSVKQWSHPFWPDIWYYRGKCPSTRDKAFSWEWEMDAWACYSARFRDDNNVLLLIISSAHLFIGYIVRNTPWGIFLVRVWAGVR